MDKKHKRITKHPKVTEEVLAKARKSAELSDAHYMSPEGQAEMTGWRKESEEKKARGGKRTGSGAKPIHGVKKVSLSLRVTSQVKEFLEECDGSAGEYVDLTIRRTAAFKNKKPKKKV